MNAQLVDELTAARDRLDRSVSTLRPADAAIPGTGAAGSRAAAAGSTGPSPATMAARFGREASSRFGTVIVRNGMEIAAAAGAPVRAVQAGRVAFADAFTGFGRVVILDHGAKAYTPLRPSGDPRRPARTSGSSGGRTRWARWERRPPAPRPCTSSSASTVVRSIRYNG